MAGNVKEWCSTETTNGRFLLGGAWNEPRYTFADYDARGPFDRAPGYGFRLAKYDRPLPPAVAAPVAIDVLGRDVRNRKPVGDEIFDVYRRHYAYDRAPLNAVVEATEETEIVAEAHRRARRRVWRRAHARASLPAEERTVRRTRP